MNLKAILAPEPEYISPDTSLIEAAKAMRMLGVNKLLVGEPGCLAGTVTDRDITVCAIAEGLDPKTAQVRQIMARAVDGGTRRPDGAASSDNRVPTSGKKSLLSFLPHWGGGAMTEWGHHPKTRTRPAKSHGHTKTPRHLEQP
jgi:hypothetical protein